MLPLCAHEPQQNFPLFASFAHPHEALHWSNLVHSIPHLGAGGGGGVGTGAEGAGVGAGVALQTPPQHVCPSPSSLGLQAHFVGQSLNVWHGKPHTSPGGIGAGVGGGGGFGAPQVYPPSPSPLGWHLQMSGQSLKDLHGWPHFGLPPHLYSPPPKAEQMQESGQSPNLAQMS